MNAYDPNDPIETLLRSQSSEVLPDNDFTAQVLNLLPDSTVKIVQRRRRLSRRAFLIAAAASIAGLLLALGGNSSSSVIGASLVFSDLVGELALLASDRGAILGLSIVAFSFATLWFLDLNQGWRE